MAATVTGASLAEIYSRLNSVETYHPGDANTFENWAVEAGDTITLKRGDSEYTIPVHSTEMVWKGAPQLKISSTGSKEREAISKVSRKKYGRGAGMNNERGIWSFVWNSESTIYSYIDQTATYITMGVEDLAASMGSALLITSSQIRSEVHASNSQLYSYIDQTATYINQKVENTASGLQSSINQQANRIGLVVSGTGPNAKIKAAEIVASINDDGTSETLISANKILLDGNTTVAGMLRIQDGSLFVNGDLTVASGKEIFAEEIRATGIRFPGTQQVYDKTLTLSDVTGMVIKAAVDNSTNTLKLWVKGDNPQGDPSITFRKAASVRDLTGSWSGGSFPHTVSTVPDTGHTYTIGVGSQNCDVNLFVDRPNSDPAELITGTKNMRQPVRIYTNDPSGSGTTTNVRWTGTITVNGTNMYNKGWLDYYNGWSYPATIESGVVSSDIIVEHPGVTPDSSPLSKTFTLSISGGYAQVRSGSAVYARIPASGGGGDVTLEDSEWDNGNKVVSAIQDGVTVATIIVQIPAVTETAWINTEDDKWYASVRLGGTTRRSDTMDFGDIRTAGYNSGWHDYFSGWTYPATIGPNVTSANIVVNHPGATPTSDPLSKTFTLSVSGGYATVSSGDAVYARVSAVTNPTLTGNWSGATLTVSSNPAAVSNFTTTIGSMFVNSSGTYYVSANKDGTELTATRKQIALKMSRASVVIHDGQGTIRSNTPSLLMSLAYGSLSQGSRTVTLYAGGSATSVSTTLTDYGDGYEAGWGAAYGCVSIPTSGSGESMTVGYPTSTTDIGTTKIYTLADNGNNEVILKSYDGGEVKTVAKRTHNKYTAGYNAGVPISLTLGSKVSSSPPVWSVTIARQTGSSVTKNLNLNSAYNDARSGYYTAAQYSAYGTQQYNAGRTQGHNDIYKITLDSGNNHANDWWNVRVYNSSGTMIKEIVTDQVRTGLYIPFANSVNITANGSYQPSNFASSAGATAVMIGGITVNVPKSGGQSYANTLTFRCDSVQGGTTYTIKLTGTPGAAMGSKFKVGKTYTMHWNW